MRRPFAGPGILSHTSAYHAQLGQYAEPARLGRLSVKDDAARVLELCRLARNAQVLVRRLVLQLQHSAVAHLTPRSLLELSQVLFPLSLASFDLAVELRVATDLLDLQPFGLELFAQFGGLGVFVLLSHEEDMVVLVAAAVDITHTCLLVAKEPDRTDELLILGSILANAEVLRWERRS